MDYLKNNAHLAECILFMALRKAMRAKQHVFTRSDFPIEYCLQLQHLPVSTVVWQKQVPLRGQLILLEDHEQNGRKLFRNALEENPETSTRTIAEALNSTQSTVWRIIHDQQFHPYHIQRVQALLPRDFPQRITMCQWFLRKLAGNPQFLRYVLFTDEANFFRNAITNFHNKNIWALENPHAVSEIHYHYQFSVNVWAAIIDNY
ncbi:hypothetical protein JTB14_026306 [Gonioctena quinquepunctata]|nr:hypothetical protein JTB14_026306 [Gonioctena quinquepunctata]